MLQHRQYENIKACRHITVEASNANMNLKMGRISTTLSKAYFVFNGNKSCFLSLTKWCSEGLLIARDVGLNE